VAPTKESGVPQRTPSYLIETSGKSWECLGCSGLKRQRHAQPIGVCAPLLGGHGEVRLVVDITPLADAVRTQ